MLNGGRDMNLTKNQIKMTKGVAILFMLLLHLFCTKSYEDLYIPLIFIGDTPLVYYLALFGDCCVAKIIYVVKNHHAPLYAGSNAVNVNINFFKVPG